MKKEDKSENKTNNQLNNNNNLIIIDKDENLNINNNENQDNEIDKITIIYNKKAINSKKDDSFISLSSDEDEEGEEKEDKESESSSSRDVSIKLDNIIKEKDNLGPNKLFGEKFVKRNKKFCKIILGEKEYQLSSYLKSLYNKNRRNF